MAFNEVNRKNMMAIASFILNIILLSGLLILTFRMGYIGRLLVFLDLNYLELPTDTSSSKEGWQNQVKYQAYVASDRQFEVCLFGDSISQSLENTLGDNTFNFAIGGMSTISQLEQLKVFNNIKIKCQTAIVALGTNDAYYRTMDYQFKRNQEQIIASLKNVFQVQKLILIPAFYPTVAVTKKPSMAGYLARLEKINTILNEIGESEKILVAEAAIQPLFEGKALKENLTTDGIHLNAEGRKIYREGLLKLLDL